MAMKKRSARIAQAAWGAVEVLESRRLLSGAPVLTISGAATANEGQDYVLNLSAPSGAGLTTWTINWGDGATATPDLQTVAIGTASVVHKYHAAASAYHVTATATDGTNTYTANTGSSSPNGSLDSGFGSGGTVSGGSAAIAGSALQTDGKLVVVGTTLGGAISTSRYNADGTLDSTFGTGGTVTTKMGNSDLGTSVAIQADGKIVVVGAEGLFSPSGISYRTEVLRYNSNGSADTGFNGTGSLITPFVSTTLFGGVVNGVAIDHAGRIVVAGTAGGTTGSGTSYQIFTGRINADGSADATYGTSGFSAVQYSTAYTYDRGNALTIQADNGIVVAGDTNFQAALVRFDSSGALDTSFGTGGWVYANGLTGNGSLTSVTQDASGNIDAAGTLGNHWGIIRVSGSGVADGSFGNNGALGIDSLAPTSTAAANSIAIQSDGQIVVAGTSDNTGAGSSFVTERYNTNGSVDTSFGGGKVITSFGSTGDIAYSIVIRPTGQIVVAGQTTPGNAPAAAIEQFAVSASATPVNVFVADVQPILSLSGVPTTSAEGTAINVTANVTDPYPAELADTWTVTRSGNIVASGTGTAIHFTPADNGTYVLAFTANDPNGAVASTSASINVTNVAPTATVSGDTIGVRGQTRHINLAATDPSSADTAAGFTYTVNWGDGSAAQTVTPAQAQNPGHVYKYDGTYKVTVTAADKDGGVSAAATQNIAITPVALEGTILAIGGVTANDLIIIGQTGSNAAPVLRVSDDILLNYKYNELQFTQINVYQMDADGVVVTANVKDAVYLVDANGNVIDTIHSAHA